jgi:hypothetical protein
MTAFMSGFPSAPTATVPDHCAVTPTAGRKPLLEVEHHIIGR